MGRLQRGRTTVAAGILFLITGCGGTGDVTGKVTLDGTALPGGLVTIYDSQEKNLSAMIMADGSYTVAGVPLGKADIVIQTVPAYGNAINPLDPPHEWFGKYVKIPLHYKERGKSGFSIDVRRGVQQMDLPLRDEPDK
jgi:hypothetical protein